MTGGDGSPVTDSVLLAGIRSFEETHTYHSGGKYETTVTVTDTESGETTVSRSTFYVTGVGLTDGVLNIVGTEDRDVVYVRTSAAGIVILANLHDVNPSLHTFAMEDVERLCFTGFSGNDTFVTTGRYPVTMHVSGGPGNDFLVTGSGQDTVTDLIGDNRIWTSFGNDTILTGPGRDQIRSGSGDDYVRSVGGDNDIRTGAGNDTVETGAGDDDIRTESGDDEIIDLGGRNHLRPGRGTNDISVISDDSRIDQRSRRDQVNVVQPADLHPVRLENEDPLTANFVWSDPSFIDGFQIRVHNGDTEDEVLQTFTTGAEFSTPNDLPDGSYSFGIRAVRLIADQPAVRR